jgi:hypothetical protein
MSPEETKKRRKSRHHRFPRIVLKVTAEHIQKGIELGMKDSRTCATALALLDVVPNAKNISVDLTTIRWSDPEKGLRYTVSTPRPFQALIVTNDAGIVAQPFEGVIRGGQVSTTYRRVGKKMKPVHKLGRRRLVGGNDGTVPDTVGGNPPPRVAAQWRRREFGLRAFTPPAAPTTPQAIIPEEK